MAGFDLGLASFESGQAGHRRKVARFVTDRAREGDDCGLA